MKFLTEQNNKLEILTEAAAEEGKDPEYYIEGVFLQSEIKNRNGRIYPREVMARAVEDYKRDYVEKQRAYGELEHPCFHRGVQALTTTGWKNIEDCVVGEKVYSINPDNGQLEVKKIEAVNINPYKGKMLRFKNRTLDTTVTPYHRFLVRTRKQYEFMTAQQIKDNFVGTQVRTYKIPKICEVSIDRNVETIQIPGIPGHNQAKFREPVTVNLYHFAGFLGFWLAEGHASTNKSEFGGHVGISQRKEENLETIRALVSNIPFKFREFAYYKEAYDVTTYTWSCADPRLYQYLKVLGKSYQKYIPQEILDSINEEQASYLLDMFILGDGNTQFCRGQASTRLAYSTSAKLIDDLSIVALIAGQATKYDPDFNRGYNGPYQLEETLINPEDLRPMHALRVLTSSGVYLDHNHMTITEEDYDDDVFCLTIEDNHTFYARDNGYAFWTGNCNLSINLDRISHLITDIYQDPNDNRLWRAKAKLLDTPCGRIAKAILKEGGHLGVSSRAGGSVVRKNGADIVQNDFRLVTAGDLVFLSSAQTAENVSLLAESVQEWEWDAVNEEFVPKQGLTEQEKTDLQLSAFKNLLENLKRK